MLHLRFCSHFNKNGFHSQEPDHQTLIQVLLFVFPRKFSVTNQLFAISFCRFVKNLSPDKINLSTLRGEGDLTNLELDEKILTDLLELPNWLTLNRAWCNRVSIRIPWTKLKSVPIVLVRQNHSTVFLVVIKLIPVFNYRI